MKEEIDPEKGDDLKPAPMLFSCRLTLFILCLVSTFTFLLLRANIGFALVCMVKRPNLTLTHHDFSDLNDLNLTTTFNTLEDSVEIGPDLNQIQNLFENDLHSDEQCRLRSEMEHNPNSSEHKPDEGEFEWSKDVQGSILGSFYYGYLFTQITGGWLVERFGARLGLIGSLISLSLLTILNPVAARLGPEFLFGVRLLMGLSHGGALSSINIFSVRWCSPLERGFLMGVAYGGFCFAAAFTFPICAILCHNFGWAYIFYVNGGFGLLVSVLAYFIAFDWPEDHPRISERELKYLQKNRAVEHTTSKARKKQNTPWRSILLSVPVNVVHITHTCFVWGFLIIGMYLPTFMKEVLYMDTAKNGLFSSLPYAGMLLIHFSVGSIFDFLRKKELCSLTNLRKLFNTAGMVFPAIALVSIGYLSCSTPGLGILGISVATAFAEFAFMGGYMFSIFELAPKYAGVLTGITNTFGVFPGFICPALIAYITRNGTREEWIMAFGLSGGISLFGAAVYLLFGSCERQPWADNNENKENGKEMVALKNGQDSLIEKDKNLIKNGS